MIRYPSTHLSLIRLDRVEEEEKKMVDRWLEEVQGLWENMMGRKTSMVGQIVGWNGRV